MRMWIILACGLALSLLGRAFAQETLPPGSAGATGSEVSGLDLSPQEALTFAPSADDRWFSADFLFGWIKGANLPALVTTSPLGTLESEAGVTPPTPPNETSILLSGPVNRGFVPGFRFGAGYTFDKEYGLGIEAGFMFLASQTSNSSFASADHDGILARPFIDAVTDAPDAYLVAFDDEAGTVFSTGNVTASAKNGNVYGVNFDLSEYIGDVNGHRVEALFGYRFAYFNDGLQIRQNSVYGPNLAGIATIGIVDDFSSRNVFHGLDLGFRSTYSGSNWSLSLLGKFSPGNMSRTVDIRGQTVTTSTTPGAPPVIIPAGLYALSSNSGSHESSKWIVVPELGANLSWKLRSNLALRLGYSALVLPRVARADDHIDFNINPTLIGAPANPAADPQSPAFQSHQSHLLIQTLNLGVDLTF